jgi:predicted dehydrogenase
MIALMSKKIRWGVLSTANIGLKKVLPGMLQGQHTSVTAIASRDLARAQEAAKALGIATAYGSYEELLADPAIDAVYIPLPNHLHVPWTIKAAEAGKHVLCEKPLSLTVAEAETLLAVRARTGVKIGEAFMIRSHPQWLRLRELLDAGRIGQLRSVIGAFSYFNADPNNIRNHVEYGGGALYDIGCYMIQASRYGFAQEPTRVVALINRDPEMQTDRLTSAILDFPGGQAVFTSAFWARRDASRSRSPSMRLRTVRRGCSSTRTATCLAAARSQRLSLCATNTHCRETPSPRPFWMARKCPFRWKKPSGIWR